jgi:hypothetical protein
MKSRTQIGKALVATFALAALLASPAVAGTLLKHHEQLLPEYALCALCYRFSGRDGGALMGDDVNGLLACGDYFGNGKKN